MSHSFSLTTNSLGTTTVSNIFIEQYMPQANGSYVKVYLYLLRLLNSSADKSLAAIADVLDETEKDVERALKYWEKQNLLQLERDAEQAIVGISMMNPEFSDQQSANTVASSESESKTSEEFPADTEVSAIDREAVSEKPSTGIKFEKPNYSATQIKALTSIDEVRELTAQTEQILGRMLKPADLQLILYLYEGIGFSEDLILYLFRYCADKNKKSISYIESVAISWAEAGIDTVEKAEAESAVYTSGYSVVNRAFGLNRTPGKVELVFLRRWFQTYNFSPEIVEEACNRTMLAVCKPDFKYADKILERWHEAGVKRKDDVDTLDKAHAQKTASQQNSTPKASSGTSGSGNRFNAFPQRTYTAKDYSEMEKKLLGKK